MKFNDYIKTALLNLKRRKFRTFLTSFAVSIGTMLIVLIMGLGIGTEKYVIENVKKSVPIPLTQIDVFTKDTIFNNKEDKTKEKLEEKDIKSIKEIPEVTGIKISLSTIANDFELDGKKFSSKKFKREKDKKNEKPSPFQESENNQLIDVIGINTKYNTFLDGAVEKIRLKNKDNNLKFIKYGEDIKTNKDLLVDEVLLKDLGFKDLKSLIGKDIKLKISLPKIPGYNSPEPIYKTYKLKGIIDKNFSSSYSVLTTIEQAGEIRGYLENDKDYLKKHTGALSIDVKEINQINNISKKIEKLGYKTMSVQSQIKQIKTCFAVIEGLLLIGAIIVVFVASIGVINTMTMSIYERTRSIGIMKALGASKKNILGLFLTESATLGFFGGLLGLLFSLINSKILMIFLNQYIKKQGVTETVNIYSTPLWLIGACIGFSMLISILAGLIPSFRASKLDPIESLKYE